MSAPSTGAELHIDRPLSNVVVGRRPEGFIADALLPITPVGKQSDLYYKFQYREWYQHQAGLSQRAPGTEAKNVAMSVSSDNYYARNYALKTGWTVEDEVNADDVLSWRQSSALYLTDRLMLDYEQRVAGLAVLTSNVGTIGVLGTAWTNPQTAQVFYNLMDYAEQFRQRTGKKPNTLILPQAIWNSVRQNEQIKGRIFGENNGGVPSREQLAALLDIPNILVPYAQINTISEQATFLGSGGLADVWGNNFWLCNINPLQGKIVDTWLNAFRWTSPMFGTPMAVQAYPFDIKKKVFEIEVGYYQDEKVVSPDLAFRVGSVI